MLMIGPLHPFWTTICVTGDHVLYFIPYPDVRVIVTTNVSLLSTQGTNPYPAGRADNLVVSNLSDSTHVSSIYFVIMLAMIQFLVLIYLLHTQMILIFRFVGQQKNHDVEAANASKLFFTGRIVGAPALPKYVSQFNISCEFNILEKN